MNQPHKVIWSEGLLLTPQHFQQAEQYQEMILRERLSAVSPYGWGFTELEIDQDALQNGTLMVRRCRAIMPDGLIVRAPEYDPLPLVRSVEGLFAPSVAQIDVLCGIPVEQLDGVNCRLEQNNGNASATRYVADTAKVHDQTTGDVRELVVARKNFKIFFSQEDAAGYTTMKIAELVRGQGGMLTLRETYIPPCLTISGAPALKDVLRGLIEMLSAKRNSLAAQYGGAEPSSDTPKLFLFHLLNTSLPTLCHLYESGRAHPEGLYLALAQLAGGLSTVSSAVDPTDLPRYNHNDLRTVFGALELKIRTAVEGLTVIRYQTIPLSKARECVWEGSIADDHLLQSGQFYFVASGESPDEDLQEVVMRRIKVSAAKDVDVILASALPGLRLTYLPSAPATLPIKGGSRYFRLEKQGDFWESICRSHLIAFYVPTELHRLRLELFVTK
jgi:type VI secretion system protein ImpJ